MKNAYISTGVHVRRLSGQTKQEKFANIQTTFLVRILEPVWASLAKFLWCGYFTETQYKSKKDFAIYFSLKKVLKTTIASYTTYLFTRVYCVQRRSRTGTYYSSRFFSCVYVSFWMHMPYVFAVVTPSWADWLAHLTSISCDSFSRSGTSIYFVPRSLKLQIICVL